MDIFIHKKEFFFNRFRKEIFKYEYNNHNHYITPNKDSSTSSINLSPDEKNSKYKNIIPREEMKHIETNDFLRLDSFF